MWVLFFFCISRSRREMCFRSLPEHEWLLQSMLHYDLIGFQSASDANNFISYITRFYRTERLGGSVMKVNGHILSVGVFPVG
ncbi:trehalose-6-phosphate synthase (plasmid) [Klebsiella pneumoniae]|nr:trehalose-6-phosphate synthase [Klebsiella pneumoniae]